MNRLKLAILLGFVIVFAAGLTVGRSHTVPAPVVLDPDELMTNMERK